MGRHWPRAGSPAVLALELSGAAVRLIGRTGDGGCEVLGSAPLDAGFAQAIDALRVEALARGRGPVPVDIWLPPEQIVVRSDLPEGARGRAEALRLLSADSGLRPDEMCIALSPARRGEPVRAVAAPARVVAEALEYAGRWGFLPGRVTMRPDTVPFGPAGPDFRPGHRISRALRAARTGGFSAAAAVLMGILGWGAWQMLPGPAPVVAPGTAPAAAPVLALGPVDAAAPGLLRPPFTQVRRDRAEALASPRPHFGGPATPGPIAAPMVGLAAVLAHPAPGVPMRVGSAPALPGRFRPARLDRAAAGADRLDLAARIGAMDRLRVETAPPTTLSSPSEYQAARQPAPGPIEAVSMAAVTVLAGAEATTRATAALAADPGDVPAAATPADARLASATMAPRYVPAAPAPRPESTAAGGSGADAARPGSAESDAEPQAASAEPDPAPSTAEAPSPGAPPSRPETAAVVAMATPTATAPAAAVPVSLLAAIAAPRPLARPEDKARQAAAAAVQVGFGGDPSPASVGQAASRRGLDLDSTSLIGVLDAKSGRQALLRTPAGRFLKVGRGDTVEGWRVSAINREAVRLTKGGQNRTLLLMVR